MPFSNVQKTRIDVKVVGTQRLSYLCKKPALMILMCGGQLRDEYGRYLKIS